MRTEPAAPSLALTLAFALAAAAPAAAVEVADLGTLEFPNSGSAAAQEPFLRAVLLLHSFEYEDAREAFREAQEVDPGFVLAYWGEAMTRNHPLWRQRDVEAAREALARLAPTPEERLAKAPTDREKGYLGAVEVLFADGPKQERDLAYSEAMRELSERYPEDLEAKSFYALSILGTANGERDERIYMRAAAVAEEVFAVNPRHPGAVHYLIHSYDDPVHAPLGLRAARVYADIAPAASHAQHMISHIYVALGAWDETVSANEKSFAVSEERARRKGLPSYERNHHALHWLEYGYLQQGRYADARRTLAIMGEDARANPTPRTLWYYAQMRAAYLVETGRWDEAPEPLDTVGVSADAVMAGDYASGVMALGTGDIAAAESILAGSRHPAEASGEGGHADCANAYTQDVPRHHDVAAVMAAELEGLIRWAQGRKPEALDLVAEANRIEDSLSFEFGPPEIIKPSHELMGELLLEMDRAHEARDHFELALERYPRRTDSLMGLARAAAALGDRQTADRAYAELRSIWSEADEKVPGLEEARRASRG
ncbi:MAG: hypothetical protein PVF68_04835 [Acidobacteriota bacterium]|jgi:tetratricopeptide (TPR) repeat protein